MDFSLGVAAALVAAAMYNAGIAVQAGEARRTTPRQSLRMSLLAQLAVRSRWIAGTLMVTLGWGLQAFALLILPLTLVQPTLAAGLLILLFIGARFLGERVGPREVFGVLAIVAGIVGLALAAPDRVVVESNWTNAGVTIAVLFVIASAPYVLRRTGRSGNLLVVLLAGTAYGCAGVATKFIADAASSGEWLTLVFWTLATAVAAVVGLLNEMSALQRRPATQVGPIMLVVDILVAVAGASALAGETWVSTPFGGLLLGGALVVIVAGATVLAASPTVAAVTHRQS